MAGTVRLDKKGLAELIEHVNNNGGDATELNNVMNDLVEDERERRPVKRREASLQVLVEESTTEERLEAEVGELFPEGLTGKIVAEIIEMDRNYTLAELKQMCVEAGLSPGGAKKELAAKLIAKRSE